MKNLYAIYDRVAQELIGLRMYLVMCFRTDTEAARYFADAINDTTSILNKHPADYDLVCIGQITDNDTLTTDGTRRHIINGEQLLAVQQPALVKEA